MAEEGGKVVMAAIASSETFPLQNQMKKDA